MIYRRFQDFYRSIRDGLTAGFVVGLIINFLILIGLPQNLENLALFSLFITIVSFGIRLGRRLSGASFDHLLKNAAAMGLMAAVFVLLLLALINSWQAKGTNIKQLYFENITLKTMHVLSGVPEAELFPNPERDPITEEFPPGEPVRTNPLRLTFGKDNALHFKIGLAGPAWLDLNLRVGGLYGFALVLLVLATISAALTWLAVYANIGQYRRQGTGYLSGSPVAHWLVLLMPGVLFALLWLTKGHGGAGPILPLGANAQAVQLFISFLVIIAGLVANRAAQLADWGLHFTIQLAICLGLVAVMAVLAIIRIDSNAMYVIAPIKEPGGSKTLSLLAVALVAVALVIQNVLALRRSADNFEKQIASTLTFGTILLLPLFMDQYQNDVLAQVGIYVLLGLGLNIVVGYAGLLNLGYVAFFALGAYAYAFLSSNQLKYDENRQPIGLKFPGNDETVIRVTGWLTLGLIVAAVVIVAGLYLWRQRQVARQTTPKDERALLHVGPRPAASTTLGLTALAIATSVIVSMLLDGSALYHDIFKNASPFLLGLVIGLLVSAFAGLLLGTPVLRLRGDYLAIVTLGFAEIIQELFNNQRQLTGGPQGILQIPRPLPDSAHGAVTYLSLVYLTLLGAALTAFFSHRLRQSRIGRAWNAMRSEEDIAQSMGVNLLQTKLLAFAIGAAFAGAGGVLLAARQRSIFPNNFTLDVSIEVLAIVIIGGMGSIPGVVVGAIVLIGLPEMLREFATYRILIFGALLVTMVILRPKGLLPEPPPQLGERARQLANKYYGGVKLQ